MNLEDTRQEKDKRQKRKICIFAFSFWLFASSFSPLKPVQALFKLPVNKQSTGGFNRYFYQITNNLDKPVQSCQKQDIKTLTDQLLQDLPSYANRASQRARKLSRKSDFYSYVLVAGRPEFEPLTLGPGVYTPKQSGDSQIQQLFFTTLERQYTAGQAIELQEFHWVFLTQTKSGWRLATMFSQIGGYPTKKPPTPPRESSDGVIAQAIEVWLRDCHARG